MFIGSVGSMESYTKVRTYVEGKSWSCTYLTSLVTRRASISWATVVFFTAIAICTWIGSLVPKHLHQTVEDDCHECTEKRSKPVDPVVARPQASDYSRSERPSWIQGASGKVNTCTCQPGQFQTNVVLTSQFSNE